MESTQLSSEKKRNPSFELLRIISMLMILTLHYNARADVLLHLGVPAGAVNIFANIMESFAITGVNVYVLISGYFLSKGRARISRLIAMICQVYPIARNVFQRKILKKLLSLKKQVFYIGVLKVILKI